MSSSSLSYSSDKVANKSQGIHTIYSEFNAAAWLVNLGIFKPEGPVTPVPQDAKLIKRGIDGGALNVDALGIPRDEAGRML